MDDVLLDIVLKRLAESPLAEQATNVLLAALDGEESLSAQLGGQAGQRPAGDLAGVASPRPAAAFLRSLTVSGFRGIGKPATLSLAPGPGLTLVVGRNGSGKSSFAEALEVLLTGELRRWEKLSAVWHQGWRSMHQPEDAEITAEFLVQGTGAATAQRTWPKGADFTKSSASVQFAGEKRTGLERLDWSKALADYRPFLSHSELEAFFGSPSGLSQGEVNALALSVFLPRARLPASPFRFLVLDDPVQAMDPAKVDGLARVLEKAAGDRQVIVFTHDNRLAQAVRQLRLPAAILEVTRRPASAVEVRACLDPVQQALRDAGALAADRSVPAEVAARVVPGLCRTAVEAAFTETIWRRQLSAGRGHAEIEAALEAATSLNLLAGLALTGDAANGGQVLPRLNAWGRRFADTFQALNKGAHAAHAGDLGVLVGDARKLAEKIRGSLP